MTLTQVALISLVGLAGPLLALPERLRLPVVLGELLAGVVLGPTLLGTLRPEQPTFRFLADMGFALVMFTAGSHVPVRDGRLRSALRTGLLRAVVVGLAAAAVGAGVARVVHTAHGPLYGLLIASSSAALVMPIVGSLGLGGPLVLELLAQVAIADTACIVTLPLVIDPGHAGRAAVGAVVVLAGALGLFVTLRRLERSGVRKRVHDVSEDRKLAVELRVNLAVVFGLAALAQQTHVSIMLAGFSWGLAVAAVGEPRRLARQLFAVTEGFFGPLFFVWLGTSVDLGQLGQHPAFAVLGLLLGAGALVTHGVARLLGQPLPLVALAAAQVGVPAAAVAIGSRNHLLAAGEGGGLLLGALVTIAVACASGGWAQRRGLTAA